MKSYKPRRATLFQKKEILHAWEEIYICKDAIHILYICESNITVSILFIGPPRHIWDT